MRLAILTLVLGAAGAATYAVAQGQWAWFLVSLGLLAAISLNLQLRLGRWIGAVTLPDEQVQRVVQAAARRVGQTPRHTWVLETAVANAFALPITQEILITRRLLEILDESELEGIVHHELGHLQERSAGWLRLVPFFGAVLLGPIAYKTIKVAALIFSPSDIALSHVLQLLGMIVILLIFFGALRFVRRFQQKAEHDADHVAEHAGDPTLYARALEKLYRANLLPAAVKGGVHPSLFDRMQSAGVTPEWPKPAVPSLWPFRVVSLIWLGSLFFYMLAVLLPTAPAWDIALGQNEAWAFDDLGVEASERQDWTTAATYLGAAEQLSDSPWHSYYLIFPLAADGRCQEAEQASQRALERASVHANEWMDADIRDGKQAIADCFLSKSKGAPQ